MTESGWLCEQRGNVPTYWEIDPTSEDGGGWTADAGKALRFARKIDADNFIVDIGWTEVDAVEHRWIPPRTLTPSPEQGTLVEALRSAIELIDEAMGRGLSEWDAEAAERLPELRAADAVPDIAEVPADSWKAFAYFVSRCAEGFGRELIENGRTEAQARNAVIGCFLDMAAGEACRQARREGREPDPSKWRKATDDAFARAEKRTRGNDATERAEPDIASPAGEDEKANGLCHGCGCALMPGVTRCSDCRNPSPSPAPGEAGSSQGKLDNSVAFLTAAAEYFERRAVESNEDITVQGMSQNAENCRKAAALITSQSQEIERMREGLRRARDWGIASKGTHAFVAGDLADWVDAGMSGPLPEITSPIVKADYDRRARELAGKE